MIYKLNNFIINTIFNDSKYMSQFNLNNDLYFIGYYNEETSENLDNEEEINEDNISNKNKTNINLIKPSLSTNIINIEEKNEIRSDFLLFTDSINLGVKVLLSFSSLNI